MTKNVFKNFKAITRQANKLELLYLSTLSIFASKAGAYLALGIDLIKLFWNKFISLIFAGKAVAYPSEAPLG